MIGKILNLIPYLALTGFYILGNMYDYRADPMRLVGLILNLIVWPRYFRARRLTGASDIELAGNLFLFLAGAAYWLAPQTAAEVIGRYPGPLLYLVFLAVVGLPPLFGGEPFTVFYAKQDTPEEYWETDLFKTINLRMTVAWAGLFFLAGLSGLIPDLAPGLNLAGWSHLFDFAIPLFLMAGVGYWFNKWYPDHYQRRLARREQQGGAMTAPSTDGPKDPKDVSSCRELLEIMPRGLNKKAAEGLEAVFQFEISGGEEFTAHLIIADGKAETHDGPHENPDVIVKSAADVWLAISRGEKNGAMAFMSGKLKAKGDLGLLMKLDSLFNK